MPSETAKTDGAIIVADKNKNKNWHNDKNSDNKNWNDKRSSWSGPAANGTSGLITGPSSVAWRSERCQQRAPMQSDRRRRISASTGPDPGADYWDYCY